jgi:transglutaminase-like putative cysteine protease
MYQQKPISNRVLIQHHTKYQYDRPVYLTTHLLRLKPAAHCRTPIEAYSLNIEPGNHVIHWHQDPFGNFVARVDFNGPVQELLIKVKLNANIITINPFDFFLDEYAQNFPFEYEPQLKKDLSPYLEIADQGPRMMQWLEKVDRSSAQGIIGFLVMVNQMINQDVAYTTRMQPGVQTSEESLEMALGSCRDSAWLLVQVFRNLGLAARFASGYLVELAPKVNFATQSETDTTALHAWTEVYIPGAGWIGLDPTSGLFAGEGHLPLACTPNPEGAAPITGTSEMTRTIFSYSSTVIRLQGN